MIIIDRTNNNPQGIQKGEAIKIQAPLLPAVVSDKAYFCPCEAQTCEYINTVFADLSDADEYKNDTTSLLFRKYISADTIEIKLEKNGQEVAILNDNTLGTYYNGLIDKPDYIGFIADWRKILTIHGVGVYQFIINKNIIGTASVIETIKYQLLPFTNENANTTARVEFVQNGSLRSSEFDLTGQNWKSQFRFNGKFWNEQPTLEVDNYLNSDYKIEQIQDRINFEYTLEIDPIPYEIGSPIINEGLVANQILITDYNLDNYQNYVKFDVQPISVEEAREFDKYNRKIFKIKFTKRVDNHIKTNY